MVDDLVNAKNKIESILDRNNCRRRINETSRNFLLLLIVFTIFGFCISNRNSLLKNLYSIIDFLYYFIMIIRL